MRTLLFPDETIRHKATSLAGNIVFHFSAKTQIIKQTIVTKLGKSRARAGGDEVSLTSGDLAERIRELAPDGVHRHTSR